MSMSGNVVELLFRPTTDREITCIVCGGDGCELEATAYKITRFGGHSRVWIGKHDKCEFRPAAPWSSEEDQR